MPKKSHIEQAYEGIRAFNRMGWESGRCPQGRTKAQRAGQLLATAQRQLQAVKIDRRRGPDNAAVLATAWADLRASQRALRRCAR